MKYIIYTSTASIYFQPEMLDSMLIEFRRNNDKHGITGVLVYNGGIFMQYIEGGDQPVKRLIKNIARDKIHHSLMIWENKPLKERLFADWSMSFKSVTITQFRMMMGLNGGHLKDVVTPTPLANYLMGLIAPQAFHQAGH